MVLGIAGSYGKNDSVDVLYERDGKPVVAAKLRFEEHMSASRSRRASGSLASARHLPSRPHAPVSA